MNSKNNVKTENHINVQQIQIERRLENKSEPQIFVEKTINV